MNRLTIGAVLVGAGLLAAPSAFAHAHLKTAAPSVGETIQAAPTEVALNFTEGLEPRFSTIEVKDKGGVRVDTGAPHLAPGDNKHFSVDVKPLTPGIYTVIWHATSVDTHRTEGTFQFTVAP